MCIRMKFGIGLILASPFVLLLFHLFLTIGFFAVSLFFVFLFGGIIMIMESRFMKRRLAEYTEASTKSAAEAMRDDWRR